MKPIYSALIISLFLTACALPSKLQTGIINNDTRLALQGLASGDDPNAARYRWTPLVMAAAKGQTEIVQAMLQYNADIYQKHLENYGSPMHAFVQYRPYDPSLDYCSSSIRCQDVYYDAACAAARNSHTDVLQLLIDKGFNPQKGTPHTALCAMQANDPVASLKILVSAGVKLADIPNASLMHQAAIHPSSSAETIHYLVQQGLSVEEPLHKSIFDRNQDWSAGKGVTPLFTALASAQATKRYEAIKALLDNGADPNYTSGHGDTAVKIATIIGCEPCVVQLMSAGGEMFTAEWIGWPAAQQANSLWAVKNGAFDVAMAGGAFDSISQSKRDALQQKVNKIRRRYPDLSVTPITISTGNPQQFKQYQQQYANLLPSEEGSILREKDINKRRDLQRQLRLQKQQREKVERLARQHRQQQQQEAELVVASLLQQNPPLQQTLQELGDSLAFCRYSYSLAKRLRNDYDCGFMAEGRYREYGESKSCKQAAPELAERVSDSIDCDGVYQSNNQLLRSLANADQKNVLRKKIRQAATGKWNAENVKAYYGDPEASLERMKAQAKRAHENQQEEDYQAAWAGFTNSLSTSSTPAQQQMAANFASINRQVQQVLIDQSMLQAVQRQVAQSQAQAAVTTASAHVTPAAKPSHSNSLEANRQRCEQQGGRFDANRNNCTLVNTQTTAIIQDFGANTVMQNKASYNSVAATAGAGSGAAGNGTHANPNEKQTSNSHSQSGANAVGENGTNSTGSNTDNAQDGWKWTTRLDCGHTHFDDVMPEKASVCMSARRPEWQIFWQNKPLLGGIHIALFSIENKSNVPLKFELYGRATGDMETKDFEWNVTVPAQSKRNYHGGIVQMEEPIHMIEVINLRYLEPVL
ncbi:hypothetical protein NO559_02495 [Dasania sp. GY-MA-18]|uniref:Uncharacterized protein n=1 Tax=Dasania phycosphaerae TaxID=2950436 RepID=A0A9J6RHX6_9GAMM|nr:MULTISPECIES: hypothetical protein [Dasania]MCR8921623.1 hypothetical protein [Dasania sp. GY-MA-18]MCZ0864051.1 hypothetical protein [Dasania phycosphaerae]MCZ0867779.1 hypothetical protein [Dasania phycosphaerae]